MSSQISSLLVDIQKIQGKIKENNSCHTCIEITKVPTKINMTNLLIAHLEDEYIVELDKTKLSTEDIIKLGLLSIQEEGKS